MEGEPASVVDICASLVTLLLLPVSKREKYLKLILSNARK